MIQAVEPWLLVLAGLALVCAGAVQGSTGFGFNMLAAPLLAIIDSAFVPGPMLMVACLVSLSGAVRDRAQVETRGLAAALTGRVLFTMVAVAALGVLDEASFELLFGTMVLAAVLLSLSGLRIRPTPRALFVAGSASGFMGTLTSVGAPPMALVYQSSEGPVMRATLNAFFVLGAAISLIGLAVGGHLDMADVVLAGLMLPFALAGFLLSRWGAALVDRGRVKIVVLTLSAASGLVLVLRAIA